MRRYIVKAVVVVDAEMSERARGRVEASLAQIHDHGASDWLVTFKVDNGVPTTDEDAEMIELSRRGVERLEHHLDAPARQGKHI